MDNCYFRQPAHKMIFAKHWLFDRVFAVGRICNFLPYLDGRRLVWVQISDPLGHPDLNGIYVCAFLHTGSGPSQNPGRLSNGHFQIWVWYLPAQFEGSNIVHLTLFRESEHAHTHTTVDTTRRLESHGQLVRWLTSYRKWLVVWNMTFIFPFSWEFHHPNWRTHIFQRGRRKTTNQVLYSSKFPRMFAWKLQGFPYSLKDMSPFFHQGREIGWGPLSLAFSVEIWLGMARYGCGWILRFMIVYGRYIYIYITRTSFMGFINQ